MNKIIKNSNIILRKKEAQKMILSKYESTTEKIQYIPEIV